LLSKSPSNLSNISFGLLVHLDNFGQNKIDDFLVKLGEELEELMEIPKEIEYEGLMLREEVKQVEEEVKEESQVLGDAQSEGESEEDESANVGEENNGTKQQNLDQPIGKDYRLE